MVQRSRSCIPRTNQQKRLMNIYYTTLVKAVIELCARYRSEGVLVMEDTCLLRPDVDYNQVAREVQNRRAGVFAFGNRWWRNGKQ